MGPSATDLWSAFLFFDELAAVASGKHPRLGKAIALKEFSTEPHVVHCSLRAPGNLAQVEGALGDRALDVALEARVPLELPLTVAGTDHIAVCNKHVAAPWAKLLGLKLLPLPFHAPPLKAYLVWHASGQRDAGHKWVRERLVKLAARRD